MGTLIAQNELDSNPKKQPVALGIKRLRLWRLTSLFGLPSLTVQPMFN